MKSVSLLLIPLIAAFCVTASVGQVATQKQKDKKADIKTVAKQLHGKWIGDKEKTAEQIKKMKDLELAEDMVEMVLEQVGNIEVEFNKDGTFDVSIADRTMAGDWESKKVKIVDKKNALVIKTETDEASGGQEKNFEIHFIGKTHMMMKDMDEGGPPIVLKRAKTDKKKD
jgi:hypothetical protein